ncbi:MAG: YitT family protein [Clostridia bacterium]|nr:YitT family protein [Clostridia bacterium]
METENNSELKERKLPPKITKENILPEGTLKNKIWYVVKVISILLLSSFLLSFAMHYLIAPNGFATGGIAGIAIILEVSTKGFIPQSATILCLNLPLIIIAFFQVRKRFAYLTTANILMQSGWLFLMEHLPLSPIVFGEQKFFAALSAGVVVGIAVALVFKAGGSTGGTDIIAVMIQRKYQASSIARMIFLVNTVVIGASFFVFRTAADTPVNQLLPILMAAFEQYVESKTNESISSGFQAAVEFRVITTKSEELAQAIMFELGHGVTVIPSRGMYSGEERPMLVCVIHRRQIAAFKKVLKEIDPDSFAFMTNVSQVVGLGFFSGEI